ncbi:MAG: D-glycerate dehydrogenase [Paracoccaceae bacterium]|jgi:hydroxypyruvate reductase|uniref:2-hydroxyacid dehydrogenase n=1 Tax=unclassified Seohaeicola TaxID=2641111 RepID=UPI00237B525D|nr:MULTISPECIES: D-glycerate dehydrogenase [unclassified Seohaeicola]MDD9707381.1 D-glycerate dehydrogenase [Seohaeicola sp. 4SK31]MDD9735644.1 D-glycerate dehydrogenase [Seohaeicola sp. SP36]MDM7969917.1 D-glycerate dehydrogenase [Paracoccaceae bacterium]
MPKVLISRRLPDSVLEAANAMFDVELRDKTTPMTPAEMRSGLAVYDAIMPSLGDKFSAEIFAEFGRPRCKMLANFGVGINHIDVEAARAHGVKVTNTPGAVTDATADTAMTLILMSARRAAEGERLVRSGAWEGWHPTQMLGLHVTGKTVGIVGMGRIGQAIARRCHFGFGMEVLFYNRSPKSVEFPARQVDSLTDMAGQVDILVVATPGGAETHHLIGAEVLAAMQPHAHLVNIARGDVVDEAALIAVLQAGQIGGAGLDVYEFEPAVPVALRKLDNVTLLPHLGTSTLEVREAMGRMVLDNLAAHFAGTPPPNLL